MVCISTFVFFDIETTGLPYQERNLTKIVELSFVAVSRSDIIRKSDAFTPTSKLSLLLNPKKTIHSAKITGLTNDIVKYSPTFEQKFNTIKSFLEDFSKPVCLVAHNGNSFDYKILLAECADAGVRLPEDLLCGDSLPYFKKIFKNRILEKKKSLPLTPKSSAGIIDEVEITDDEDEWPDMNVSSEELQEIDDLCSSLSDMSCESGQYNSENVSNNKLRVNKAETNNLKTPENFKLTEIYKTLLQREPQNAHRAEGDCLMLLQCVGVCQNSLVPPDDFLSWIDVNYKRLNDIKPLIRK